MNNLWLKFLAATIQFTRIPVSSNKLEDHHFNQSVNFIVLIGAVIGACCASVFWLFNQFFPHDIAIVMALLSGVLLTGGLHEDGFADSCDAFGGGSSKETILAIMKDSRLGSYGTLGLIFLILGKFVVLSHILQESLIFALFLVHIGSRTLPLLVLNALPHCASDNVKMSQGIESKPLYFMINVLIFLLLTHFLFNMTTAIMSSIVILGISSVSIRFLNHKLQGYNGDSLGAVQQLGELGLLLVFALY